MECAWHIDMGIGSRQSVGMQDLRPGACGLESNIVESSSVSHLLFLDSLPWLPQIFTFCSPIHLWITLLLFMSSLGYIWWHILYGDLILFSSFQVVGILFIEIPVFVLYLAIVPFGSSFDNIIILEWQIFHAVNQIIQIKVLMVI